MPVGFKWFVPGLFDGSLCFGGEESAARASSVTTARVWTTDKDGLILDLLAAEITARTGKDPGEHYRELTAEFGTPYYTRIDAPATPAQKARLAKLSPETVKASTLAGEPIIAKLTRAPGNGAPIGGLKVVTASGWFAARPSGTENIYKIYAESFGGQAHLDAIVAEARADRGPCHGIRRMSTQQAFLGSAGSIARRVCCCTVTSLPGPMASGISGRAALDWMDRLPGPGKGSGRCCRWGRRGMATRRTNASPPSPATSC